MSEQFQNILGKNVERDQIDTINRQIYITVHFPGLA